MTRATRRARKLALMLVAFVSIAAAFVAVYSQAGPGQIARAETIELLGLVALLVLPGATIIALRLDSRAARARRRSGSAGRVRVS